MLSIPHPAPWPAPRHPPHRFAGEGNCRHSLCVSLEACAWLPLEERTGTVLRILLSTGLLPIMHGKPYGRAVRIAPFHTMARVCRNVHVIARPEPDRFGLVLEHEDRRALQHDNPF